MPRRYHEALNITPSALRRIGAFDGFVDLDSEFYVDPRLLGKSRIPELRTAFPRLKVHFRKALKLLRASKQKGDRFWDEAVKLLLFPEVSHTGLGYGVSDTGGSGIGPKLAGRLASSVTELLNAGIVDPDIFELVGLFQEGFGADRVSDMTVYLALPEILSYNARVIRRLNLPAKRIAITSKGPQGDVPWDVSTGKWFLLLPESILSSLPVAYRYSDIEYVCRENRMVREYVNSALGDDWKEIVEGMSKGDVRELLIADPAAFADVVRQYKATPSTPYDFVTDPDAELRWWEVGRSVAEANPIVPFLDRLRVTKLNDKAALVRFVKLICERFKHNIEFGGASEVLRDDNGKPRVEKVAQRLFLCVADAYCKQAGFDLSPEPNAGSGPVDFKISGGYSARVLVEIKRSSNTALEHGYTKQLEIYKEAESTAEGFFVIVNYGDRNQELIRTLLRRSRRAEKAKRPFSRVIVVDAQERASASKA